MALSEEDDRKCWRINENLNRYHEEREKKRQQTSELLAQLESDKAKLVQLRLEEGRAMGTVALSIPLTAAQTATALGAAAAFYQLNAAAQEVARVWAEIEAAKSAIEKNEKELAPLEARIAELTTLMAQSWDAFYSTGCGLRHLPVGVPRPPAPRRGRPARQIRGQPTS